MFNLRRKKPLIVTTAPAARQAAVYISHQSLGGLCISRFFCSEELLREHNEIIMSAIRLVVMPALDTELRKAVRFHRYYLAITWLPADDMSEEVTELEEVMLDTLTRIFGVKIDSCMMPRDENNPWVFIRAVTDTALRLGVDWGPTSYQRVST